MKLLLNLIFLTLPALSFSQSIDSSGTKPGKSPEFASFITKLDIAQATKDGIYLNGYVVNMSYDKMKELNGKTIKVTGRVTIVKGVKNGSGQMEVQGRERDSRHILFPKIRVIKE